jgi:hypothetical protein
MQGAKRARRPEPPTLAHRNRELTPRWPLTRLRDGLTETEGRVGLPQHFTGPRGALAPAPLPRRRLLGLFGLGPQAGRKRVGTTLPGESAQDLV